MKSYIKVDKISYSGQRVMINFSVSKNIDKYFKSKFFWYEQDLEFAVIPESIMVIPFVVNVLPLVWLLDAELILNELDKQFFDSISSFKKGYKDMYPALNFVGTCSIKRIVENSYSGNKSIILYSGGLDAITTLLRHRTENIETLTLWGSADYPTDDEKGWNLEWDCINSNLKQFKLQTHFIKSNFCDFIKLWGPELQELISISGDTWWHGFQHGIGIIGHAAPLAYILKAKNVYIASSYDVSSKSYTCASDPTIDNYVRFGSTLVKHDGYELNRQDKTSFFVEECKTNGFVFNLHVCLQQYSQTNCCRCEKCYRTILGLLAEGADPQNYGFDSFDEDLSRIFYDLRNKIYINKTLIPVYQHIQSRIISNKDNIKDKKLIEWALHTNLRYINVSFKKIFRPIVEQIRSFLHI